MSEQTAQSTADRPWGIIAEFEGAEHLLEAAARVREAGFRKFDVHSPYPIHGMDQAMGLGRSKLGWIVLMFALAGAGGGMGLQWYTQAVDYPIITGGLPYFAWQAFLVVTFELTVLSAAFGALIGMLWLNGLPMWYHPTLKHEAFLRASSDKFFIVVESADERFDPRRTVDFLVEIGGREVASLEE